MQTSNDVIAEAFSRTAARYDAFAQDHPHLARLRSKVYAHIEQVLPAGARILELNAGTGIDALELARRGYQVHATDISAGMLARARTKIDQFQLNHKVSLQQCSFTDLHLVEGAPYDAVFSNLGGLNCIPDLWPVIRELDHVLQPGGTLTWVLMPPVCLWEMAEVLRGNFRLAFRRFHRGGVMSHLEGLTFPVYYYSPRRVLDWLDADFELVKLEGLSVITPTAESKNFAKQYPGIYRLLCWLDDRLSPLPPWWGWGDFFIVTMRYKANPKI